MSTTEKEKKRKRHSEGNEKPRKRSSLDSVDRSGPKIKITHLPRDDEHGPVIACAPGISFPPNQTLQAYSKKRSGPVKNAPRNELLLHSSEHPRLDYTARENDGGNSAESLLKHYVGIYDPLTQELEVVEARNMSVRATLWSEQQAVYEEQHKKKAETRPLSLRQELGMTFGTKKARKAISSLAENAISPSKPLAPGDDPSKPPSDSAAAAILSSISDSAAAAPSKAEVQATAAAAKPRPKPNLAANKPQDVYPVSEIVGDAMLREVKVKPWVEAVDAGEPVATSSRFVSNRLEEIVEADDIQKLKVLKYLMLLIKFFQVLKPPLKNGTRKLPPREVLVKKMEVDAGLVDGIRRRFADGSELTKWHGDKLITHCCAISLIVDDFESDTHDLRTDLGLNPKQMTQYFSEVGAKVSPMTAVEQVKAKIQTKAEASQHPIARLVIPLQFPKERRGAVPRRR